MPQGGRAWGEVAALRGYEIVWAVQLGQVGIWTTYGRIGEDDAAEAAALVEDLGFGTFWLGGSPEMLSARPLLEATNRITVPRAS